MRVIYELQIRTENLEDFKGKGLGWIKAKILEGEHCGFGEKLMWEIVKKEVKDVL